MVGVRDPLPGVVYPPVERLKAYIEAGGLPSTTLVEALCDAFGRHGDRPAIVTASRTISYADLDRRTDRLAAALLELGLRPLDRVLFQAANSPELVIAIIGCLKAGLIPTCTLPAHRESEIGYIGRHVSARAHIVQGDDPKFDLPTFALRMKQSLPDMAHVITLRGEASADVLRMEDLIDGQDAATARARMCEVPRDPFQVAIFQLSGGTTGVPKVIPRMQNDYLVNALLTIDTIGYRPDDVMFMPMPIIHNACMVCFLMPTLLVGASFSIAADMTVPSWTDAFRAARPTWVGLIRALLPRLQGVVDAWPEALDSVRAFWTADAAKVLRERYNKPAYGMFGMSEGLNIYCRPGDPDEALDGTVGRPMSRFDEVRLVEPGTEIDVADGEIGEMIARGPYTISGYYDAEERNRVAFTSDGFYRSGDLMIRRDIEGEEFIAFAGRTKDVVDRGAEKISCEEVETAILLHDLISECAVVGMPDLVLGERACAYIVTRGGRTPPKLGDIQRHLEALGLAKFKWPERIEPVDEIPLTKVGKVDKVTLRMDIARKLAPAAKTTLAH